MFSGSFIVRLLYVKAPLEVSILLYGSALIKQNYSTPCCHSKYGYTRWQSAVHIFHDQGPCQYTYYLNIMYTILSIYFYIFNLILHASHVQVVNMVKLTKCSWCSSSELHPPCGMVSTVTLLNDITSDNLAVFALSTYLLSPCFQCITLNILLKVSYTAMDYLVWP